MILMITLTNLLDLSCLIFDMLLFYKYFLQNGDDRALTAANYIKYGTNDNQEIWLLKYGVMFEDITILKPHITSINQNELIVNQTFYQLPEDKRRAVERFVN